MILNLRHVGLVVPDMDKGIRFYGSLGCKVIARSHETWGNSRIEVCKMTNKVELIKGTWKNHVAFTVDNLEGFDAIHEKQGVKFIFDPFYNVIELVKEDE